MSYSTAWRATQPFREYVSRTLQSQLLLSWDRYTERTPRPSNPMYRPAYQGSNPVADIFSLWALQTTVEFLPRVAQDSEDLEARKQMLCETRLD